MIAPQCWAVSPGRTLLRAESNGSGLADTSVSNQRSTREATKNSTWGISRQEGRERSKFQQPIRIVIALRSSPQAAGMVSAVAVRTTAPALR
jgi:hypothetical protein